MSFVFEVGKLVFDIEGFIDDLKISGLAKYIIQHLIIIAFGYKTGLSYFNQNVFSGTVEVSLVTVQHLG